MAETRQVVLAERIDLFDPKGRLAPDYREVGALIEDKVDRSPAPSGPISPIPPAPPLPAA